jgi:hypothetical protein
MTVKNYNKKRSYAITVCGLPEIAAWRAKGQDNARLKPRAVADLRPTGATHRRALFMGMGA